MRVDSLMSRFIGLFGVTIHQALFIAPCSHAFHYKCIRPLLDTHHPSFNCPLCRTYANLEEDVEVEIEPEESIDDAGVLAASLATPVIPENSRERDTGAETEVEPDSGMARLGPNLRRRVGPPLPGAIDAFDVAEDVDEEMEVLIQNTPSIDRRGVPHAGRR